MGHTNITNSLKLFSQTFLQTLGVQLTKNPFTKTQKEVHRIIVNNKNSNGSSHLHQTVGFFPNGSVCFDVLTKHCISDISLESLEVS